MKKSKKIQKNKKTKKILLRKAKFMLIINNFKQKI